MPDPAPTFAPPAQLLPWHEPTLAQLRVAWAAGRFPHALLLQGADGLGKRGLASWLAGAALCETRRSHLDRCGTCTGCHLINASSHPDLLWIAPEEDKQQLSVDQVRTVTERFSKTSYRQGYKVAVIEPAHLMTPSAANSVLKTLEEPPPNSLLILITSQPSVLLPTLRSRCQRLAVARPAPAEASAWLEKEAGTKLDPTLLEFAGGAPLKARDFAGERFEALDEDMQKSLEALFAGRADVTQVAAAWAKDALVDRLVWVDLWLSSSARAAVCGTDGLVTFPRRATDLPSVSQTLNITAAYGLVDRARALKSQLARTALQRELAVESWLIALLEVIQPKRRSELEPSR